ncbi:MAG: hypothetical protein HFG47_01740 [Lachnospiraceae bacterium]|nr:hypothetical protein [Lachnospiraceae bacterium]
MQYDFLSQFPKRMKSVGLYAVLLQNSIQKTTWKQYGFVKADEQVNVIFAVLLYIMEQSLKEEHCTMDDIGAYIDTMNMRYFKKPMGYQECKQLGDFIVNVILSNEGRAMYFEGFDFGQEAYQPIHISYVANRIVYVDQEFKRTSYYLTDDGYNLLLSTLEIENNMKLTIHEMVFQMHLEKQSYDKAVDEIKNVFNLLRVQLQKIQEAMGTIRRNALNYSVKDYEGILLENLETISDTKQKFKGYRDMVKSRAVELEEKNINVRQLSPQEDEKLNNLREIERYLNRTIDEHQKILNSHFDLKALYTRELEQLSQMSLIKRFPLRAKLYDKILENPAALAHLDYFFRPLFNQDGEKSYNLNKAFQLQRPNRKRQEADSGETLDFNEELWQQEKEQRRREKLKRYEGSLRCLLSYVMEKGEVTLKEIGERLAAEGEEGGEKINCLIPNVEVFKEIMVELIKNREIDLDALQKERSQFIQDKPEEFQLNDMLLTLAEGDGSLKGIRKLEVYRTGSGEAVVFAGVRAEDGTKKQIRCSDVLLRAVGRGDEEGLGRKG